MRALDPEALNAVWVAVEALLPPREDNHPLGCHNPRISDRICFRDLRSTRPERGVSAVLL